jgi:glucan phosphoethanolaminetransferase (alkaline phosphatase superfamily)
MNARSAPAETLRKSTRLVAAAGVLYAAPSCVVIEWAAFYRSPRTAAAVLLAAMIVAAVMAAIARYWRSFFVIQFPLLLLGIAYLGYTVSYGMPPGQTLASLLAGASLEEIKGFLLLPHTGLIIVPMLIWAASYLAVALWIRPAAIFSGLQPVLRRGYLVVVFALLAITATDPAQLIDGLSLQPIVGSVMFLAGDLPRARDALAGHNIRKTPYGARRSGVEEVHILVLGESARRDSWSAYGYRRDTMPLLSAVSADLVWLRDASADANLTEWAVPIRLTGIPPDRMLTTPITGNIVDLAREAGYRTAWLVNQDIAISTSAGVSADTMDFPPDFNSNINGRHTLDEVLLPAYRRELARSGQSRFIGIHMMGSHWEYYNRYPSRFQQFGGAQGVKKLSMISVFVSGGASEAAVVDAYDNSVLYSDWFLRQIIDGAARLRVPATVTFFPDHGEDLQQLDGNSGHGAPEYTRHAFQIPAFLWFNQAYQAAHPQEVAAVRANAAAAIRSYELFPTLGHLMGISWPGFVPARLPRRALSPTAKHPSLPAVCSFPCRIRRRQRKRLD